eukprot:PLAT798.1.p1 GENE.PLAT798.1~~PLAT798.1.p1  ORF type:complete len:474 (+),score=257.80 PLAT798.1:33-1454(+)
MLSRSAAPTVRTLLRSSLLRGSSLLAPTRAARTALRPLTAAAKRTASVAAFSTVPAAAMGGAAGHSASLAPRAALLAGVAALCGGAAWLFDADCTSSQEATLAAYAARMERLDSIPAVWAEFSVDGFMDKSVFLHSRLSNAYYFADELPPGDHLKTELPWMSDKLTYSEFLLYSTLLSIPEHHFDVAFRLFDKDGSGQVDPEEFTLLLRAISRDDSIDCPDALRQRLFFDKAAASSGSEESKCDSEAASGGKSKRGSKKKAKKSSKRRGKSKKNKQAVEELHALASAEADAAVAAVSVAGDGLLSLEEFVSFIHELKMVVLKEEFRFFAEDNVTVYTRDIARMMVSTLPPQQLPALLSRIEQMPNGERFSFDEWCKFERMLARYCDDIMDALRFYGATSTAMRRADFARAFKVASGELPDARLVSILFDVFDGDGDGDLDLDELQMVLSDRRNNSIGKPVARGISGFVKCVRS